jgi:hypothetical protein
MARTANEEIAGSLKTLLPPVLRSLFSPSTIMTELVPYMMRIISPPLRPVSFHFLHRKQEQAELPVGECKHRQAG